MAVATGLLISFATDDKGEKRHRSWVSEKLSVLRNRPAGTNVIFTGASVTLWSIVPDDVDAAAAAAGCGNIKSINLGMPGARVFETAFMIDKVLETTDLPAGSFVIYDAISDPKLTFDGIVRSNRAPVAARFRYLPDVVASAPLSWRHALSILAYLRAASSEALAAHIVSDIALEYDRQAELFETPKAENRGYLPLEQREGRDERREQYLARRQAKHEADLRNWSVDPFRQNEAQLRPNPFAGRIRDAGFTPLVYAPPWPTGIMAATAEKAHLEDPGLGAIIIGKDNAPDIFAGTGLWFDDEHVTEAGAKRVSEIVGRSLCSMIKGQ